MSLEHQLTDDLAADAPHVVALRDIAPKGQTCLEVHVAFVLARPMLARHDEVAPRCEAARRLVDLLRNELHHQEGCSHHQALLAVWRARADWCHLAVR